MHIFVHQYYVKTYIKMLKKHSKDQDIQILFHHSLNNLDARLLKLSHGQSQRHKEKCQENVK